VQKELSAHLRDRDKERQQHKHDEAVHCFNALLADLVSVLIGLTHNGKS
jgi:transcription elongation regulator 1